MKQAANFFGLLICGGLFGSGFTASMLNAPSEVVAYPTLAGIVVLSLVLVTMTR